MNNDMSGMYSMAEVNRMLYAMLGDMELVKRWWSGNNKAFDNRPPIDIWSEGKDGNKRVWEYVSFHGYR